MTVFTIDGDNNITALAERPADSSQGDAFGSEKEFAKLTGKWPVSRLIETWNSFAGVAPFDDLKPVKKFTNRKAAVGRIWAAVQRLATVAPQSAHVTSKKGKAKKSATKGSRRDTCETRDGSKKAEVLELLRRKQGATLAEIMNATGWQAHSVRGFISGTLGKRMGLNVESIRGEDKPRTYRTND
jgi:hypothetical protein